VIYYEKPMNIVILQLKQEMYIFYKNIRLYIKRFLTFILIYFFKYYFNTDRYVAYGLLKS
jgi:hypothetical protein